MPPDTLCAPRPELDIIVRELDQLTYRLIGAAQGARGLAAGTNWHARAARVFHEKSEAWAGSVARLCGLAETTRLAAVDARVAATARAACS